MTTLTLTANRAGTELFTANSHAVVFTDRVVRQAGVPILRVPLHVFEAQGLMSVDLAPNALCDDPDFFYVVSLFNGDGSINAQHRIVMPETAAALYDLVPVVPDLDAC